MLSPVRNDPCRCSDERQTARLRMFKAKIHRATVTHADLDYEGSVTTDAGLVAAAEVTGIPAFR